LSFILGPPAITYLFGLFIKFGDLKIKGSLGLGELLAYIDKDIGQPDEVGAVRLNVSLIDTRTEDL